MNKLIEKIKEYWKDPVFSKVIAAGIIFIIGTLLTSLYAIFQKIFSKISFNDTLKSIFNFLTTEVSSPLWTLVLLITVFLTFTTKPIVTFFQDIINKLRKLKTIESNDEPKIATEYSTVLFSSRMAKSFPGIRGLTWINEPSEAIVRLQLLLKKPLKFKSGAMGFEPDPIWWFRGSSSMYVDKFEKLGCNKVLINFEQLKIKRIAAYHSNYYYRNFVYVETFGEKQTGLYKLTKDEIIRQIEYFGYSWEEYGLIKYLYFWKRPIRREDYDDGATIIKGKVVEAGDAKLRVRYLTDYNFIIAAKGSPYNSSKFERDSKPYLDGILKGTIAFNDFFDFLETLNKNER